MAEGSFLTETNKNMPSKLGTRQQLWVVFNLYHLLSLLELNVFWQMANAKLSISPQPM